MSGYGNHVSLMPSLRRLTTTATIKLSKYTLNWYIKKWLSYLDCMDVHHGIPAIMSSSCRVYLQKKPLDLNSIVILLPIRPEKVLRCILHKIPHKNLRPTQCARPFNDHLQVAQKSRPPPHQGWMTAYMTWQSFILLNLNSLIISLAARVVGVNMLLRNDLFSC